MFDKRVILMVYLNINIYVIIMFYHYSKPEASKENRKALALAALISLESCNTNRFKVYNSKILPSPLPWRLGQLLETKRKKPV